jgi:tetratricopeptide (TPR) repeat protein
MGWSRERLDLLLHPPADSASAAAPAASAYDYGNAFDAAERSVSSLLTPEPRAGVGAASLLAELETLSSGQQIERARDPHFVTPELIRLLIEHSHDLRYKDAGKMLHYSQVARVAAESCPPGKAGDSLRLADLRARAWGQYGNSLRVCDRPREAEEAFASSRNLLQQGTKDPMLRAWLLERTSALLIFQEDYQGAVDGLDEAGQIYRELGESHLQAGAMVQMAIALIYLGQAERAISALNHAISLIDYREEPHLLLAACHNLIRCYIDIDRPDQALALYSEARPLYEELDDPLILLRATWQEGQLLRDLGHLHAAETALLRCRKGFQEKSHALEAAQVSLDLAAVYVRLGKTDDVRRTVLTTVPIFHALRVKLDTLAALLQLQQVADQEQHALELIRNLTARVAALPKK